MMYIYIYIYIYCIIRIMIRLLIASAGWKKALQGERLYEEFARLARDQAGSKYINSSFK